MSADFPRLLDPARRDAHAGACGELSIVVPAKWLQDGARISVALPGRLRCGLCGGGGCDVCDKSGGYLVPEIYPAIVLTLPRGVTTAFALRVASPLGECEPKMLIVRVDPGEAASNGVTWLEPHHDVAPRIGADGPLASIPFPKVPEWVLTGALLLGAAIVGWLMARVG